ncbi:MAG: hypothetical protein KDA81_21770, partial [Planctomycetaceae bacterium]|nr:hypothetical protein [Planctomycetaceae bacterium]
IERQHPGTVALVSIGAGSDQNPISGVTGDKVEIAEAQGLEIAGEVTRLLSEPRKRISGVPTSVNSLIQLPLNELPTREQLIAQTGQGRPTDKYNATTQLAQLDRGQPLLTHINYPIQTWTFGDSFCMTFLAGEVCVDYALRLKQELDRERFWLNTYSNDFCCYIPSERLAVEGGYGGGAEVPYFALPTTLKAGLEQKIIDEVHRQVPTSFHAGDGTQGIAPQAPEESLQCMSVSPGLQVVLAASEPNVTDPVAIDFGPDGRLWVAEMSDYGRDVYESFAQSGKVRWLRDSDNDGHFETAVTFVDGLRFPTDVKVWRDGVLICDAPDILWARDTSGDGKADDVTKLFTGFEVRNAQARVNSLRWGLDNWLYGAGGLFGGTISSLQTRSVVECSNRDFRMNPDSGVIEPVTGNTQQGRCRNDWGEWFGCSNGTLLRPISSDDAYERRNPLAIPSSLPSVVIDADAHQLFPPADLVTFELSGAPGRATSACGLGIYRDTLLGDDFLNDAFTCEPVHQSVHRIDFRPTESGFVGSRAADEEDREFLSSTDRWFRPVQVRTGPDGALWVVDMYRFVIEHSRWIPQSTLSELNVFAGTDRGRIYRVLPSSSGAGAKSSGLIPDWTSLSDDQLADHLETANGIQRDLVHQQLIWRKASGTASKLRTLAAQSRLPAVRLQALAALDGLERLTVDDVKAALHDDESEVQRFSVLLSERWLAKSDSLQQAVAALASTPSVKVRRQVALSLGVVPNDSTAAALA